MSVIWASFRKEVREVLRDKRTLMLTVLVPMVFYPALLMLAGGLDANQQAKEKSRELLVGFEMKNAVDAQRQLLADLASRDETIKWIEQDSLDIRRNLIDGVNNIYVESEYVEVGSSKPYYKLTVHYFSTAAGETDLARVKSSVASLKAEIVESKVGRVIDIAGYEDYATERESAGSKFGGLAAYFIVFLAFTGCLAVAVDVAAGEKERGTLEAMLVTPASFWEITFGKLFFVVTMGLLSVVSTAVGIGSMILIASNVIKEVSLGGVGCVSILGILFLILLLVFFFAVLLFAMSILARSSKEAHMRGSLLMLFIAMALVYCTLPGVSSAGNILFVPVLNVALALRALWEGSMTMGGYLSVVGSLLLLSWLIIWYISRKVSSDAERMLLK